MRIDFESEPLGRELIRWVQARNEQGFQQALDDLETVDPAQRDQAVETYRAVAQVALREVYRGHAPNEEQNRDMATALCDRLPWANCDDAYALLENLSVPNEPTASDASTTFVVAGYLLAWHHQALGHSSQYEWLDRILTTLTQQEGAT